ncbi:hypothetical protein HMPREF0872_03325 [Veillonella montpellierensis DNF00314]|uniref:Lipoprotein signal peptidase n=1 Tax=Veillonella montpellierensis DNF00314 TaxID=1401067 RepID=A0A096ALV2_9FIRM|nr:signal peptidase II [Veillonella montpellierensis]KGF47750.1 hypothetical protein HMPREF0872_03325 [Veillonella montpellierensis DNF00314]
MFYGLLLVCLVIDQITKYVVRTHMMVGDSIPLLSNVFHITYILNRGAAFGILENQRLFFLGIVLILLVIYIIFRHTIHRGPRYLKIGAALLMSGAIGNGWDRFHYNAVIDFFDFRIWPIFNVADITICIGVSLVAYYMIRSK